MENEEFEIVIPEGEVLNKEDAKEKVKEYLKKYKPDFLKKELLDNKK